VLALYIYFGFRFSDALSEYTKSTEGKLRTKVFGLLLLINLYPIVLLFYYLIGDRENLFIFKDHIVWQDYLFTFPFWIGLILIIEILPYYLILDVFSLTFRIFKSKYKTNFRKVSSFLRIALPVIFILFVGIRIYFDTNYIRNDDITLQIKNLPASLNNFTLVFFGDIQVDRYTNGSMLKKAALTIESAQPDLILFAGDMVTRGEDFIEKGLETLCGITSPIGTVACMGDHDYWANPSRIENGLRDCGWKFLDNQLRIFDYRGSKILVTGLTYIYSERISKTQIEAILMNAPEADLKILLVHQPAKTIIEAAEKAGYDLLLAGHTHGGQVVFKPFRFSLTPTRFENEYFSGLQKFGNLNVIITNGIGLTLAPIRYRAPAEISKIILVGE
jgi:predicted MPP superfamily phosphohydrolase